MKLPLTGGCQCGRVRYAAEAEPLTLYACHCTECQRQSASAFGLSMPVLAEALRLTSARPKEWRRTADSGRTVACQFCGDCGTRLLHRPERNPAVVNLKPGTLDDTAWLDPLGHVWTKSAQPWLRQSLTGPLVFAGQPEDFAPFYAAWHDRRRRAGDG